MSYLLKQLAREWRFLLRQKYLVVYWYVRLLCRDLPFIADLAK